MIFDINEDLAAMESMVLRMSKREIDRSKVDSFYRQFNDEVTRDRISLRLVYKNPKQLYEWCRLRFGWTMKEDAERLRSNP